MTMFAFPALISLFDEACANTDEIVDSAMCVYTSICCGGSAHFTAGMDVLRRAVKHTSTPASSIKNDVFVNRY